MNLWRLVLARDHDAGDGMRLQIFECGLCFGGALCQVGREICYCREVMRKWILMGSAAPAS
jgi:hypothetical protein